ncbi:hypothetical protein [Phytohabitans aurantiacus]|uniref:Abortive infection protein-like C-terminal domain-containing protein n=1 Tax=Phytohabitans aurantiacus TaxID=3016789 RepID=A0ABQ5R145_9ACTN|nr:hypothetical protein [Phytohabitans aurantiacus]GLH99912.1 hypothetical protein Pa4123_51880 [Phytohabitans aurantiacus]
MTSTPLWQTLSRRGAPAAALHEGVPRCLHGELRDWIYDAAGTSTDRVARVFVRLHLRYVEPPEPEATEDEPVPASYWHDHQRSHLAYQTPVGRLLDIVDALLDLIPVRPELTPNATRSGVSYTSLLRMITPDYRGSLQQLLDDARSVYRISDNGRALVRRADTATAQAFHQAVATAQPAPNTGSAAEHLYRAWTAVHALRPDPPQAYSHAIKAVEAAAHATIQPNHAKATLGTMLGELRNAPHKFSLAGGTPGTIAPLIEMMDRLWTGQTSRHGSQTPTQSETLEQAEMAIDLAIILVRWFTAGTIRRQP